MKKLEPNALRIICRAEEKSLTRTKNKSNARWFPETLYVFPEL
jgi:hypothetical protein